VRHRPAPAPPPARWDRFLDLTVRVLRPRSRPRGARLALGALVSTVLTALILSVPVVSGAVTGTPFVAAESFATDSAPATSATPSAHGHSPVVMGRDGRPVTSSTFAGVSTSSGTPGASSTDAFAGSAITPPAATSPATAPAAAPAPEPVPAPGPAPEAAPAPEAEAASPASTAVAPAPAAAAPADRSGEEQVLALVNEQRAAAGCGALTADPALATLARAHSADMRDRDFFDHVNPDGLDPFERGKRAGVVVEAENIAYGQPDPAAVMDGWMKSPGHRANILDCDLTRLGVGVAEGPGGPWWTQDFA